MHPTKKNRHHSLPQAVYKPSFPLFLPFRRNNTRESFLLPLPFLPLLLSFLLNRLSSPSKAHTRSPSILYSTELLPYSITHAMPPQHGIGILLLFPGGCPPPPHSSQEGREGEGGLKSEPEQIFLGRESTFLIVPNQQLILLQL